MKYATLILLLLTFLYSCSDYVDDLYEPNITILQPSALDTFKSGDFFSVHIETNDDVFLESFEFSFYGPIDKTYSIDTSSSQVLYGENADISMDLSIPFNALVGNYIIEATAYDKRKRVSLTDSVTIFVKSKLDDQAPIITLNKDTIRTFSGTNFFAVQGNITDNVEITSVAFEVTNLTGNNLQTVSYNINADIFEILEFLETPASGSGTYEVKVIAYDNVFNSSERKIVLIVN